METIYHTVLIKTNETYVPPRARKARVRAIEFEHAVQIQSYTVDEAPVVARIERSQTSFDEAEVEIRSAGGKLHKPRSQRELHNEVRCHVEDRFACAREAQERFNQLILIDGEPWEQCGEPVYTYSPGRFSDYEWIKAELWDEQSVGDRFYNAFELDAAREAAQGEYRNVSTNEEIVVLDPSCIKFASHDDRVQEAVSDSKQQVMRHVRMIEECNDPNELYDLYYDMKKTLDNLQTRMLRLPR